MAPEIPDTPLHNWHEIHLTHPAQCSHDTQLQQFTQLLQPMRVNRDFLACSAELNWATQAWLPISSSKYAPLAWRVMLGMMVILSGATCPGLKVGRRIAGFVCLFGEDCSTS